MLNKYLKQILSYDYLGLNAGSISSDECGNEDQKPSSEDGSVLLVPSNSSEILFYLCKWHNFLSGCEVRLL